MKAKRIRLFNLAAAVSVVLLCDMILLLFVSRWIDPAENRISISSDFHISVSNGSLLFFNSEEGPYMGSIIWLDSIDPRLERKIGFGETLGIYYRYFRWPDSTLWTLMLSLWYPIILLAVLPLLWCIARKKR